MVNKKHTLCFGLFLTLLMPQKIQADLEESASSFMRGQRQLLRWVTTSPLSKRPENFIDVIDVALKSAYNLGVYIIVSPLFVVEASIGLGVVTSSFAGAKYEQYKNLKEEKKQNKIN